MDNKILTNKILYNIENQQYNLIYMYGNDNNKIIFNIKYIINFLTKKNYHVYYSSYRDMSNLISEIDNYDLVIIFNIFEKIKLKLNKIIEYCMISKKTIILSGNIEWFNLVNRNNCIFIQINKDSFDIDDFNNISINLLNASDDRYKRFFEKLYNISQKELMIFLENNISNITDNQLKWSYKYYKMREKEGSYFMNSRLEDINKEIVNIISDKKFIDYDIKSEIYKDYNKISSNNGNNNYDIKMYNDFVNRVTQAKKSIKNLNQKYIEVFSDDCTIEYKYIQRYLLYRYQAKENKNYFFDCDSSYLVRKYYEVYFNYKGDEINNVYYDTYFSVQSIWGKLIENLYERKYRNDFKWQIENFESIIMDNPNLKKLFNAFDDLAHYYHTIGNIAPCPAGLNVPKGLRSNCYDRIDLFFKSEARWRNFYYNFNNEITYTLKNDKDIFYLTEFLNPKGLEDIVIPIDNNDIKNIEILTKYINEIVNIIKRRGIKLIENV